MTVAQIKQSPERPYPGRIPMAEADPGHAPIAWHPHWPSSSQAGHRADVERTSRQPVVRPPECQNRPRYADSGIWI